jgi:hypothetical protein
LIIYLRLRAGRPEGSVLLRQEIKGGGAEVLEIGSEGDSELEGLADDVAFIPSVDPALNPVVAMIPLQVFAGQILSEQLQHDELRRECLGGRHADFRAGVGRKTPIRRNFV